MTDSYEMYEKKNSIFFQNSPDWGQSDSEGKAKALFRLIQNKKLDIKTVVEIGCGAGGVLVNLQKLLPPGTVLQGYDIAEDAIELAHPKQNNQLTFYKGNFLEKDAHVDLLIMADVFEHIEDYYGFLRQARLKADHFLFSIPLDVSVLTLLRPGMLERQQTHNGHIHYFSEKSACLLLKHAGYEIIDSCLISRILDLRRKMPINHYLFWRLQLALLGRRWATILSGECVLGVYAR